MRSLLDRRDGRSAARVYLLLNFGQALGFALFFTVQQIYQVTVIGLNPLQMVLVGTVLEIGCLLFEVPTGVIADVYSRRLSILVGVALMGGSYLLEGLSPTYAAALISQLIWALGYTCTSGANEAWITDEVGEDAVGPIFLRARQTWLAGIFAGTALSMGLGVIQIQLPMVLAGGAMLLLAAGLLLLMPERHMRPTPPADRSTFGHMAATARDGLRLAATRPVARVIVVVSLIVGLGSEAFDRLSTPSLLGRFTFPELFGSPSPVVTFGLSAMVGAALALAASEVFRRRGSAALGAGAPTGLLAGLAVIDAAAVAMFALAGELWLGFAMLWLRVVLAAIADPVQTAWLNRHLEPASRATVISLTGQANAVGQLVGGPALGWLGSAVSLTAALIGSAVTLAATTPLYLRAAAARATTPAPEEDTL